MKCENNQILFVTEKWVDTNPTLGPTPTFRNYFYPFRRYGTAHLNTIHIDESAIIYKVHINDFLIDFCLSNKIKVVIFSLIGDCPYNPSLDIFKKLNELGIQMFFIWHDIGPGWGDSTIRQIGELAELHISVDNSSLAHQTVQLPNLIYIPAPQDESIFYPQVQDIPISFIGSQRVQHRVQYLQTLIKEIPEMVIYGGQRETRCTIELYAELIRRSKIGINFCYHSLGYCQTKGRVSEILASGSLLLEEKNLMTPNFFRPGEEYVEYTTLEDLVDKARYYLSNNKEREEISSAGRRAYMEKYSTKCFWDMIFSKIN